MIAFLFCEDYVSLDTITFIVIKPRFSASIKNSAIASSALINVAVVMVTRKTE